MTSQLTITYIIGTSSINDAEFPGNSLDALKSEIKAAICAAYPTAKWVDVVLANETSAVLVDGLEFGEFGEKAGAIEADCVNIGEQVWDHGQWHYAE